MSLLLRVLLLCITLCTTLHRTHATSCRCNPPVPSSPTLPTKLFRVAITLSASSRAPPHKLAMIAASIYDATALTTSSYTPLLETCIPPQPDSSRDQLIAYAAYAAMEAVFADTPPLLPQLRTAMSDLGFPADNLGSHMANLLVRPILSKYSLSPPSPPYTPTNPPSATFDASCDAPRLDKWQPQCVQVSHGAPCMTQTVPFAALSNAPLLSGADLDTLTSGIPSPPTYELPPSSLSFQSGMSEFGDQYLATLNTSRTIGDYHKAVAELFSRNAALQVAELAVEEMEARGTSAEQAAFVLMAAMGAARDAAVAAVTLKLQYETARPSSVLQCAFGNRRLFAWKGAYRGVGRFEQGQLWRSYLTNPPFPGYVSGHSGIAVAGARVLAAAFGGDVAGVNCRRRMQGESMVEPRVERGAFGYVEGVTDVPNKGADTVGYSPARNVTVCWRDWNGFSDLVVRSRLLAGIHVPTDNFHGEKVGEAAAEKMLQLARGLCVGDSCLLK